MVVFEKHQARLYSGETADTFGERRYEKQSSELQGTKRPITGQTIPKIEVNKCRDHAVSWTFCGSFSDEKKSLKIEKNNRHGGVVGYRR